MVDPRGESRSAKLDGQPEFAGKGQVERLVDQHEASGGVKGIFGKQAKEHDLSISSVAGSVLSALEESFPEYEFRWRRQLTKSEIHLRLNQLDERLGVTLFVGNSSIRPDGGLIEVLDNNREWRVVLVGESKHQGNDVEKILAGVKQGKNKDQDLMAAGNAIERVHKNIDEMRNFMIEESHFPYVVFLQGSNFATETFYVSAPDGRKVKIAHDAGFLNRIDRVTASNFGMAINKNHCRNLKISAGKNTRQLQVASLYFQAFPWTAANMFEVMLDIAKTSISVLEESFD